MSDPIAILAAAFALSDDSHVDLGFVREAALQDPHHYMVGRLLTRRPNTASFLGTMPMIWRMREGLSIRAVGDRFVFEFDNEIDRNWILHGGPWFYRNTMLLLAPYDGISDVEGIPIHSLELWITVRGLPFGLRNQISLSLIGSAIGRVLRFDLVALNRKDEEQRIRLVVDIRRHFRIFRSFSFSAVVDVNLSIVYEKTRTLCRDCGMFMHSTDGCDRLIANERAELHSAPPVHAMAGLSLFAAGGGANGSVRSARAKSGEGRVLSNPRNGLNEPRVSSGVGFLQGEAAVRATHHENQAAFFSAHLNSGLQATGLLKKIVKPIPLSVQPKHGLESNQVTASPGALFIQACKNGGAIAPGLGSVPGSLSGLKRRAEIMMHPGKKLLALPAPNLAGVAELSLSLPQMDDRLIISPQKKKKAGRPKGSKNKAKLVGSVDDVLSPRVKIKGRKRFLKRLEDEVEVSHVPTEKEPAETIEEVMTAMVDLELLVKGQNVGNEMEEQDVASVSSTEGLHPVEEVITSTEGVETVSISA